MSRSIKANKNQKYKVEGEGRGREEKEDNVSPTELPQVRPEEAQRAKRCLLSLLFPSPHPLLFLYTINILSFKRIYRIDHLRNDVMQHTRTPSPTMPGSNSM